MCPVFEKMKIENNTNSKWFVEDSESMFLQNKEFFPDFCSGLKPSLSKC